MTIRTAGSADDFGLEHAKQRSRFVLALAGMAATLVVHTAIATCRMLSWWVAIEETLATRLHVQVLATAQPQLG